MSTPSLPVLDPTAAAIDVGSEQLHLSIAGGPPKVFGTTTGQLYELRDWLLAHGVKSVAMEATGIYWLCPYEVLEKGGLEVVMVNGKYVKNLPGRKSDMKDCQWQATLHAHGLLKPGFVPRSTSAACRTTCACAPITSRWQAVTNSICKRPWNG